MSLRILSLAAVLVLSGSAFGQQSCSNGQCQRPAYQAITPGAIPTAPTFQTAPREGLIARVVENVHQRKEERKAARAAKK